MLFDYELDCEEKHKFEVVKYRYIINHNIRISITRISVNLIPDGNTCTVKPL